MSYSTVHSESLHRHVARSSRESRAIPAGGEGSGSEGAQGDHEGDEDRGTRGPLDGTTFGAKFTHLEEESNGDSLEETAGLPPKTSRWVLFCFAAPVLHIFGTMMQILYC